MRGVGCVYGSAISIAHTTTKDQRAGRPLLLLQHKCGRRLGHARATRTLLAAATRGAHAHGALLAAANPAKPTCRGSSSSDMMREGAARRKGPRGYHTAIGRSARCRRVSRLWLPAPARAHGAPRCDAAVWSKGGEGGRKAAQAEAADSTRDRSPAPRIGFGQHRRPAHRGAAARSELRRRCARPRSFRCTREPNQTRPVVGQPMPASWDAPGSIVGIDRDGLVVPGRLPKAAVVPSTTTNASPLGLSATKAALATAAAWIKAASH